MDLGGLIKIFRRDADDEETPPQFSNADVAEFLNEAQEEACIRGRLIVDTISVSVRSGTAKYKLPETVAEIRHAALVDSAGTSYILEQADRIEMDRKRPDWRTVANVPTSLIHDDKAIVLAPLPNADYTLSLEVHRTPKVAMAELTDTPEIAQQHHRYLVYWALFRAFSAPDSSTFDPDRASTGEGRFTRYFGKRPGSSGRRSQPSNRPHRNKLW